MNNETDEHPPLYLHDCTSCVYLGVGTNFEGRQMDVYYCADRNMHLEESIVVRWKQEHYARYGYYLCFLLRMHPLSRENSFIQPYLFGLEQAKNRGLIKQS